MRRFKAVLLLPLDQQDSVQPRIDPAGVTFAKDVQQPVWPDFNYDIHNLAGWCLVSRADDGSLVAEGEIDMPDGGSRAWDEAKLAIGVMADHVDPPVEGDRTVAKSALMSIGITWKHADSAQPVIELL